MLINNKKILSIEYILNLIILSLMVILPFILLLNIIGVSSYNWSILPVSISLVGCGLVYGGVQWYAFNSNGYK